MDEKGRYSVKTIAEYIIDYCDKHLGGVSNLRLQKLLYFVQVEFVKTYNYAAFKEEIEAWSFGPVVPQIYRKYKIFGRENIILNSITNSEIFSLDIDDETSEKYISFNDKETINKVLNEAAEFPTAELVRISMVQKPWKDAYNGDPYTSNIITKESIYDYFVGEEFTNE